VTFIKEKMQTNERKKAKRMKKKKYRYKKKCHLLFDDSEED